MMVVKESGVSADRETYRHAISGNIIRQRHIVRGRPIRPLYFEIDIMTSFNIDSWVAIVEKERL
jgi:hypothetical protein